MVFKWFLLPPQPIHFDLYRKEILFKKLWMSSSIFSESLHWRFRGIQGVKRLVVIYSSSFCASLFNIYYGRALSSAHSLQFLSTSHILHFCWLWKGNFPNDLSFSICKSIRGKIRESSRQRLLSLLCATVVANKAKRSSICFSENLSITGEC